MDRLANSSGAAASPSRSHSSESSPDSQAQSGAPDTLADTGPAEDKEDGRARGGCERDFL